LERNGISYAVFCLKKKSPCLGRRQRRRNVAAGVSDQLQIRLQGPPRRNAGLISQFEHRLVIAYWTIDAREHDLIPVQAAAIAKPPKSCANAQHVELAVREETLEGEAGVDLEAEQVAVGRGVAKAKEGGQ